MASKEHARRAFPKIRRVYQDRCLKIMVRLSFLIRVCLCVGKELIRSSGRAYIPMRWSMLRWNVGRSIDVII